MSDTVFATAATADHHNGEVVLVDIEGTEYALPESTARAFVDDVAAAVDALGDDTTSDQEAAAEEFLERTGADAPTPRTRDDDAEWVMGLSGEDRLERIAVDDGADEYYCSLCGYDSESEVGVRRHQGHQHDSDGEVVEQPPDDESDEDDPLADATDWTPENGTADEEDLVELANPDSGATRECQNCESQVSKRYVEVFEPDDVEQPRACPNCEDLIRDGNEVREKRA